MKKFIVFFVLTALSAGSLCALSGSFSFKKPASGSEDTTNEDTTTASSRSSVYSPCSDFSGESNSSYESEKTPGSAKSSQSASDKPSKKAQYQPKALPLLRNNTDYAICVTHGNDLSAPMTLLERNASMTIEATTESICVFVAQYQCGSQKQSKVFQSYPLTMGREYEIVSTDDFYGVEIRETKN